MQFMKTVSTDSNLLGEKNSGCFFSCINQTDSFASGLIVARLVWAMTT